MSALPAIGASINYLRPDAKGYVFAEILSSEDKQNLNPPDGMEEIWVNQEKNNILKDNLPPKSEACRGYQDEFSHGLLENLLVCGICGLISEMRKI